MRGWRLCGHRKLARFSLGMLVTTNSRIADERLPCSRRTSIEPTRPDTVIRRLRAISLRASQLCFTFAQPPNSWLKLASLLRACAPCRWPRVSHVIKGSKYRGRSV
jgi:hypothetical protein